MPLTKAIKAGITIPELIKTAADDDDYLILFTPTGDPYKITKTNFLSGLSGVGNGGGGSGDTYFNDVVLLLPFDGNINDIKGHSVTATGTPTIDTTQYKNGTGSLNLDGDSYL